MERYVVFMHDTERNEEFVRLSQAPSNTHNKVLAAMRQQYPQPRYTVHTAYTETELAEVLASVQRWCGGKATAA